MSYDDRYGQDVLAGAAPGASHSRVPPQSVPASVGVVAEDPLSGFCGAVIACSSSAVTLEDRFGRRRVFPLALGAFLVEGRPTTLTRPVNDGPADAERLGGALRRDRGSLQRSASGSVAVRGLRARTARASRIWVEGIHDATLLERIWGHDLRVAGIVVEPLGGLDHLPDAVSKFGPTASRRVGVLADHLVAGSKESRIAAQVAGEHVLVTGHPYVDVWQAVRPAVVGISAWPEVPRGRDWKTGVCEALGVRDTTTMWRRINGAVGSVRDVETPLVTAVEMLIDFVTTT